MVKKERGGGEEERGQKMRIRERREERGERGGKRRKRERGSDHDITIRVFVHRLTW